MASTKRATMGQIKAQFRMERHREFLTTALRIVSAEGLTALTMQGLADELECGIGTLYRHFPSKGALVAELQREALDLLITSFRLSQGHLDDILEARGLDDPELAALARVVVGTRFWISAEAVFPQEVDLSRRMFVDHPALLLEGDMSARVMPAAWHLLDLAAQLLDAAVDAGALRPGPGAKRAVILIAGTTGVLRTSGFGPWDTELFDGADLSTSMVHDLLRGWDADPVRMAASEELVGELARRGHLVPVVGR